MRTSEEYRAYVATAFNNVSVECSSMMADAADLIDSVPWAKRNGFYFATADGQVAAYRASLRPAKPASGCEGCVDEGRVGDGCLRCIRYQRMDRWAAKP